METYNQKIDLNPAAIVKELNRYIVGQEQAKRAVAVALRNRYRRIRVTGAIKDEIYPKNILMIGSTGVGKTEIARRLAKLVNAPFVKVEATKFTEIGYVGRDVDTIIRDLADVAARIVTDKYNELNREKAKQTAINIIIEKIAGKDITPETHARFVERISSGQMDTVEIELRLKEKTPQSLGSTLELPGMQIGMVGLSDVLDRLNGGESKKLQRLPIKEALEALIAEESEKLANKDKITEETKYITENEGIVFLDEVDKICLQDASDRNNRQVSREGVQRDLLPLVEGTVVNTRFGDIHTDHILFIASGAFYSASPSDLLPELQGRFPVRVKLDSLTEEDLIKILTEPENNLIRQYQALMEVDQVNLKFNRDGIREIAHIASELNGTEDIGARRLHTIMEKVLEEISFSALEHQQEEIVINKNYVKAKLNELNHELDLSKFIL